jgi:hypothetical protein
MDTGEEVDTLNIYGGLNRPDPEDVQVTWPPNITVTLPPENQPMRTYEEILSYPEQVPELYDAFKLTFGISYWSKLTSFSDIEQPAPVFRGAVRRHAESAQLYPVFAR